MATVERRPVEDSVAKIGDELAVGEDLDFQRKWWKFEKVVWALFLLIVLLDLAGVFGRGPVAKAHVVSPGKMIDVTYERIERFSTPSILTLHVSPAAVQNGKIYLWVSDSVVKDLGNQRVIPQPLVSQTGNGGIFYTFPTTARPNSVEFALEPSAPGVSHAEIRIVAANTAGPDPELPPLDQVQLKVVTLP